MTERLLAIIAGALAAVVVMLLVAGDRLTSTTIMLGAALVGLAEFTFGARSAHSDSGRAESVATGAATASSPTAIGHDTPLATAPGHSDGIVEQELPSAATSAGAEQDRSTVEGPAHEPAWHEATASAVAVQERPAEPPFERPPLAEYLAMARRDPHQCPNCAAFDVTGSPPDYSCARCGASWHHEAGGHWPDVRPLPHLQENH